MPGLQLFKMGITIALKNKKEKEKNTRSSSDKAGAYRAPSSLPPVILALSHRSQGF